MRSNTRRKPLNGSRVWAIVLPTRPTSTTVPVDGVKTTRRRRRAGRLPLPPPHVPQLRRWGCRACLLDAELLASVDVVAVVTAHDGIDWAMIAREAPLVVVFPTSCRSWTARSGSDERPHGCRRPQLLGAPTSHGTSTGPRLRTRVLLLTSTRPWSATARRCRQHVHTRSGRPARRRDAGRRGHRDLGPDSRRTGGACPRGRQARIRRKSSRSPSPTRNRVSDLVIQRGDLAMVDHLLVYHPGLQRVKDLIDEALAIGTFYMYEPPEPGACR